MADAVKVPTRVSKTNKPSAHEVRVWASEHGFPVTARGPVSDEILRLYKNATATTTRYEASVYLADESGEIAAGLRQTDWKKFGKDLLLVAAAVLIGFAVCVAILFTV